MGLGVGRGGCEMAVRKRLNSRRKGAPGCCSRGGHRKWVGLSREEKSGEVSTNAARKFARENVETVASQMVIQRANTSSLAHKSPVFGEQLQHKVLNKLRGEVKPSSLGVHRETPRTMLQRDAEKSTYP